MNLDAIRRAVIGKSLSCYDSFNGHSDYIKQIVSVSYRFKVKYGEITTETQYGYDLTGEDSWGRTHTIYIERHILADLIKTGIVENTDEIDHCSCKITYKIR